MKITFVLPHACFAGGVRVVAVYAEHLKKRGHEVVIVSTPQVRPSLRQQMKSLLKDQRWVCSLCTRTGSSDLLK